MTEDVQELTFLLRKGDQDEKDFTMDRALGAYARHHPGISLQRSLVAPRSILALRLRLRALRAHPRRTEVLRSRLGAGL